MFRSLLKCNIFHCCQSIDKPDAELNERMPINVRKAKPTTTPQPTGEEETGTGEKGSLLFNNPNRYDLERPTSWELHQ